MLSQIAEEIKKQGINTAIFNERCLPFMNSAMSVFFHKETGIIHDNFEIHVYRLTSVVHG